MDNSKFHMWRATIAMAWVDNKVTAEEKAWLKEKFANAEFSTEQKEMIENDFKQSCDLDSLLPHITTPAHRSQLVYFARLIFHSDKDFNAEEKQTLKEIEEKVMGVADLRFALKKAKADSDITEKNHEKSFSEKAYDWLFSQN